MAYFRTGTNDFSSIKYTNLEAGNIKNGVTVTVKDPNNVTLKSVTGNLKYTLDTIIRGGTIVAYGGGSYGAGCSYKATEDCYLLCGGGGRFDAEGGSVSIIRCYGYTKLLAGGHKENYTEQRWYDNSGVYLVFAKKGATVTCDYVYNTGGSGNSMIIKLTI